MPKRTALQRSCCPIANALDLLGDRWTLLVVRDLLYSRKTRFVELQASPEGVPTNLLTDRLRRLERAGVVRKKLYQRRPRRYEYHLTAAGAELATVLRELIGWANRHIPGTAVPPPGMLLDPPGARRAEPDRPVAAKRARAAKKAVKPRGG